MFLFWLPALLVFVLDRATKAQVVRHMHEGDSLPVMGEFFRITSVRNTGAAFGLFAGNQRVFAVISIVAILLVLALYFRSGRGHRLRSMALGLILGGALGNLFDRLTSGRVVDFLDLSLGRLHWPVFNVADSAVTIGVALLAIEIYVQGNARKHQVVELSSPPGGEGS